MRPPGRARPGPRGAGNRARLDTDIIAHGGPSVEPLAVSAAESARLAGVSRRHWTSLEARGLTPAAVRLGKRKVWVLATLRRWLELGAPSRERFEQIEREEGGRR